MPYFACEQTLVCGETVEIAGAEASHLLKSRRLRNGERFAVQDPSGARCLVELVGAHGRRARVKVLQRLPVPAPPPVQLHLLQAAVKDKAAEWIVQKSTELGVAALAFFPAANSPLSHNQLAAEKTLARREKIAAEAGKQCDRQFPPTLAVLPGLAAALRVEGSAPISWLLDPAGEATPASALGNGNSPAPPASAARVLVGPEGGFTEAETASAREAGFTPVRLGGQSLRAETAALAACALLLLGT